MPLQNSSAGLIIGPDAFTFSHRYQIIELVNKAKLPAVYPLMPYATAGGLLSYGVDLTDLHRRAAIYIDRILPPRCAPMKRARRLQRAIDADAMRQLAKGGKARQLTGATADQL